MGDHYVPKYYLSAFSQHSGKQIWVYDKKENRKFTTQVKSVANENGFYSPEVEEYLANVIEGPANSVLEKIRKYERLTETEKGLLAEYMAAMLKRVPQGKERVRELAPSVSKKLSREIDDLLTTAESTHPEKVSLIRRRKKEAQEILDRYSRDPPKDIWLDQIPTERNPNVVAAMGSMIWRFLTFEGRPAFLTCDNPVFYFTGMGIGDPESEITFPVASDVVLWATWRKEHPEGYFPTNRQIVKEINRRTARNATRYVFHSQSEEWILPFITKGAWELNRIQIGENSF